MQRKQGANREYSHGSDERPEIRRASVAKWMLLVRRATAAPLGDEQQHLVAAVCEGMECFCPHRARPSEQRSHHLRDGGGEVRDQGNRDGKGAVGCFRTHSSFMPTSSVSAVGVWSSPVVSMSTPPTGSPAAYASFVI